MEVFRENGKSVIVAAEGRALRRSGTNVISFVTRVSLAAWDSVDAWEECDYGEPIINEDPPIPEA